MSIILSHNQGIYIHRWIHTSNKALTLSLRRSLPYRNQSIDLLCQLMNWFLYDKDIWHEKVRDENGCIFHLQKHHIQRCDKYSWGVWRHAVSAPTGVQGQSSWKLWLFSLSNNAKPPNSAEFLCTKHAVSLLCFLQNFIVSSKLFHPFYFQHADLLIPRI